MRYTPYDIIVLSIPAYAGDIMVRIVGKSKEKSSSNHAQMSLSVPPNYILII
ncbi:MAG: hypothetical protein IIC00_16710 [Planctomycetes bacterium]|nr:hypothetical protein [Planctomycetota bacterium]